MRLYGGCENRIIFYPGFRRRMIVWALTGAEDGSADRIFRVEV